MGEYSAISSVYSRQSQSFFVLVVIVAAAGTEVLALVKSRPRPTPYLERIPISKRKDTTKYWSFIHLYKTAHSAGASDLGPEASRIVSEYRARYSSRVVHFSGAVSQNHVPSSYR